MGSKISIIIPTLNRQESLKKIVSQICKNKNIILEILIIEQGDIDTTKKVLKSMEDKRIKVIFSEIKSSSIARNVGIKNSKSEFLLFLDDDILINKETPEVIINEFNKSPKINGITCYDIDYLPNKNMILKVFLSLFNLDSFQKKTKILNSGFGTPIQLNNRKSYVEYLSPGHMALRKSYLEKNNLTFPEYFLGWSCCEGMYLTHSMYKLSPKSLILHPKAKVRNIGKAYSKFDSNKALIRMRILYQYIFWYNVVKKNRTDLFFYLIANFGLLFISIIKLEFSLNTLSTKIKTYEYLIKNKKQINKNPKMVNKYIYSN